MKKLILLALTAIIMAGCYYYEDPSKDYSPRYRTVYIDDCEYLMDKGNYCITHKGNCRFCAERRKKELEELVIKIKGE